jgi:CheY-like chemotaxis protein
MRALIIHEPAFLAPIKETLAGIGYSEADLVSTAAAARAAARRHAPDLIVSTYRLPDGTIRESLDAICGARECPVVFVTIETDAVLNWLPSAVIVARPFERIALEIAVEEAIAKPFRRRPSRHRPIGGPAALIYS